MKHYNAILLLLFTTVMQAQLKGHVVDHDGQALQDVSVYIQNSYKGTVTNKEGFFILENQSEGGTLVLRYLGYQTQAIPFSSQQSEFQIQMKRSPLVLSEIKLNSSENPAHIIIRKAQAQRKTILEQNQTYTAQFYSRGIFSMQDVPEKFLGVDIGDFEGALDSTRSGILYLSETQSKIFRNKKDFTEQVIASKVSGNDNGFSFNSAKDAELNFYQNTLDFGNALASPIGRAAFTYYKFRLEDSFYTSQGKLINKINISPKTSTAPAFSGTIYIVEDDWVFYGIDVVVEKQRMRLTGMEDMRIVQQFQYNSENQRWSKTNQVIDFAFGLLGFEGQGRFSAVYSDYDFSPRFAPKIFGPVLQSFAENANQKDSLYWQKNRPIRLTQEEQNDYIRRDSIQQARNTPRYLDSIDKVNNRFKWNDIFGKTVQNSKKNTRFTYISPLQNANFNAVQGYIIGMNLNWNKEWKILKKNHNIRLGIDYGFSDKQWYPSLSFDFLQNKINYSRWHISAERKLMQFDKQSNVTDAINAQASLLFKNNLARFYEQKRLGLNWRGFLSSRFQLFYGLDYAQRIPRTNSTQHSILKKGATFATNRPSHSDYDFEAHRIFTQQLRIQYRHKSQYYETPNERFYSFDERQPRITLQLEQGLGSTISRYNYLKLDLLWRQSISIGAVGQSQVGLRAGSYLIKEQPSFMDLTHFHGNEIFLRNRSFRSFQLLPYYQKSTNNNYAVAHWEHDFYKWGLGSWPVFRHLQASILIGGNALFVAKQSPYWEGFIGIGNIGIGKIRGLRVDWVQSWEQNTRQSGVRLGLDLF